MPRLRRRGRGGGLLCGPFLGVEGVTRSIEEGDPSSGSSADGDSGGFMRFDEPYQYIQPSLRTTPLRAILSGYLAGLTGMSGLPPHVLSDVIAPVDVTADASKGLAAADFRAFPGRQGTAPAHFIEHESHVFRCCSMIFSKPHGRTLCVSKRWRSTIHVSTGMMEAS